MEGFTIIDGVVAAVVIISALLAYSRGLVREVMAIGRLGGGCGLSLPICPNCRTDGTRNTSCWRIRCRKL